MPEGMKFEIQKNMFVYIYKIMIIGSLVPRLSPHANEKWKGKGRAW